MFKFAAAVVDFYDDPEFFSNVDAQDLFGAVLLPAEEIPSLPDGEFAIKVATVAGVHRKFPIYNKASVALSGRYFDKIASELPEEIKKAAGYHLKVAHAQHGLDLPESLNEDYELTSRYVEYRPDPAPPMADKGLIVKIAQHSFMNSHRQLHPMARVEKAAEIDKVASSCGELITEQEVWDYVPKDSYGPFLKEALIQREALVATNAMQKEAFATILKEVTNMTPREAPFLLYEFDKMAGLDTRYGLGGILDPFYGAWGGMLLPKIATPEKDLFQYKLQTVTRHKEALKAFLPERYINQFIRDPKGTYETSTDAEKKAIDFFMKHIPSDVKEKDVEFRGRAKPALWTEEKKIKAKLEGQQTAPSDRPSKAHDVPTQSPTRAINEGL